MRNENANPAPAIQVAEIVEILPTRIWIESDFLGGRHVVLQHQDCEQFTYASFGYDWRYTSNAGTYEAARQIALALGAQEPIEERTRGLEPPDSTAMQYLALTDAMHYEAGPQLLSPEEYAAALYADAARYRWLMGDCDGDAQDDVIQWLAKTVASKGCIDALIDNARMDPATGAIEGAQP
jgi:hypothetical protein